MKQRHLLILLILLLIGAASTAQALDALTKSGPVNLVAQPLEQALHELARQLHIQIICDPQDCQGILAPRVVATQTAKKNLDALLRGTGLYGELINPRSIGIFRKVGSAPKLESPAGPKSVPPVQPSNSVGGDSKLPEIIVRPTGSNFSGGVPDFPPTKTFSHLDIEESGAFSLGQFLSLMTQNLNSNSRATYAVGAVQNGEHGTSINLRGLGERGTLVLINGHRVAPAAMGQFVDISLIPIAFVEQIEVLSEGASAIYGADAVTGVVNIILRKDFSGIESDIGGAWPSHSGANQFSAAQTAGTDWEQGNLMGALAYNRQQSLLSADRPYSNTRGYTLLPALTDYSGYLSFHQDLAFHVQVDVDGMYSNRHTDDYANYLWSNVLVGPYKQQGVATQYFVSPSLTWSLGAGWNLIGNFNVSQNRFTEMTTYGAEAPSGVANYSTLSEARVRTLDARADGPLIHLRSGDVRLALGLGERWEDSHSYGSTFKAVAAGSLRRKASSAYGELYLPLVGEKNSLPGLHKLDLKLAVRGERHQGAGSTGNPKFDFLWQPLDSLTIRGSYATSYTVAGYIETLQAYNALAIERSPSTACASGSCLVAEEFGANSPFRPEHSKSYTVGFEWVPENPAGLRIRSDFYSIHYFDQIVTPPDSNKLVENPGAFADVIVPRPSLEYISGVLARGATYPQGILNLVGSYDPAAFDFYIDHRTRNYAHTLAMGVDFDLGYDLPSPYGVWTFDFTGTRVLKLDDRASSGSPDVSVVDTFAHPLSRRYEGLIGLRALSGITMKLRANYFGSYTNNQVTPAEPIASWLTFDAILTASLDQMFPGLKHSAHLEFSVANLTDRDPPYVKTPSVPDGYDPVQADALGRFITMRFVVQL